MTIFSGVIHSWARKYAIENEIDAVSPLKTLGVWLLAIGAFAVFGASFFSGSHSGHTLAIFATLTLLVGVLCEFDLSLKLLPDRLHMMGGVVALVWVFLFSKSFELQSAEMIWLSKFSHLPAIAVLFFSGLLFEKFTGKMSLGRGDLKFMVWFGVFLPGLEAFCLWLVAACLAAGLWQLITRVWNRLQPRRTHQNAESDFPFMPALGLSGLWLSGLSLL